MLITFLAAIVAFALGACIITVVSSRRASELASRLAAAEAELTAGRSATAALQSQLAACAAELRAATEARICLLFRLLIFRKTRDQTISADLPLHRLH